ncbi:MAG TPA: protein phosphatase 2C domain-containing protein [Burkholderiaceae bacterium]|nr:protein phosphatase 2C domain-containing protein [Burkholderiaceae bacterium]
MPVLGLPNVSPRAAVAASERATVSFDFGAATDPGPARPHNEDRWQLDAARGVFVLADGMGGFNAGEVASEIAVRTTVSMFNELCDLGWPADEALTRSIAAANRNILEFAATRPECLGMGTTAVAAAVCGAALLIAHAGDSRAYLLRNGRLQRLTRDHSVLQQMIDAGGNEALLRRRRAPGILTRALGVEPQADAELRRHDWRAGDVLLLCSDGLTDAIDDAAIAAVLLESLSGLQRAAAALVDAALAGGAIDNVTVLLAGQPCPSTPEH